MIDWQDGGLVLEARVQGENAAIATLLTLEHGKISGLVHGGAGRRMQPLLQPGTSLSARYRARLDTQMGTFTLEMARARSHHALASRLGLSGLSAVTSLLTAALPEGDPHPHLFHASSLLLDLIGHHEGWELLFPLAYLNWEMQLLTDLGFALDLSSCAATGGREELIYVSPKSARAVSKAGAGEWAAKLLPLPPVLRGEGEGATQEILIALKTTGYFLQNRLLEGADLPAARGRFLDALARL